MVRLSKSGIDRLGERLSASADVEADLVLLDEYRRSFGDAYVAVVEFIRRNLGLQATGRPAKSTRSICAKLRRESVRLTQMQDIAGCRLVVENLAEQDRIASSLSDAFPGSLVFDRRQKPSHGYRAIHIVIKTQDRYVEVQVRTLPQHVWAELSEKLSDAIGIDVKYGGGPARVRRGLDLLCVAFAQIERLESKLAALQDEVSRDSQGGGDEIAKIDDLSAQVANMRADLLRATEELSQVTDGLTLAIRSLRQ